MLANDAPGGICPWCSLRNALESGVSDETLQPGSDVADVGAGEAPRFPARFGDYDLLEVVGRGGMGVVYRARQRSLDRIVAVKVLAFGAHAGTELLEHFRTEATAAASLRHPHIVAIHATGVQAGWPYLAMDYVNGPDLAKLVATSARIPAARSARYVRDVAHAIHFAHEHGVLHRDLKPSNVLLDEQDQPRLTDFGLARRLADQSQLTLSRPLVGSPGYLPPEQADARLGKVSRRSDVYGLGAILYHLLTGRAPFGAPTSLEMVHQVLNTEATRPRSLDPGVPRDLETICLRCLEKDPARRYATADEVAQELDRFLEGRPTLARPLGLPARAWRWCRRRPLVVGLALLAVIASWLGTNVLQASRELKREQRDRAIDAALTAAWAGDSTAARTAITEASRHGARPEWVEMLEGQVALHTLHSDEAMAHFERAVQLAPEGVAPRAMLVSGALWRGDADRWGKALAQLDGLEPSTALEYFSLGMALIATGREAERSVTLLERAVQMRPSGISFLALALAEGFCASDSASWELAQRAVDHVNSAELILGSEHPAIRVVRMNTTNVVLRLCPADEQTDALRRAGNAAAALASTTDPIGHMQRAFYFQFIGDEEVGLVEWEHAARRARTSLFVAWYSAAMLGCGRSDEALRTLDELPPSNDPLTAVARAYLLCDVGRSEEANRIFIDQASRTDCGSSVLMQTIPLMLGDRARCARESALASQAPGIPPDQRALLACLAGSGSWSTLLTDAGTSHVAQGSIHHHIALSCLAEGDRGAAMQHFRASLATQVHWTHPYQWSRAILRRMEGDPTWPPWSRSRPPPTGSG